MKSTIFFISIILFVNIPSGKENNFQNNKVCDILNKYKPYILEKYQDSTIFFFSKDKKLAIDLLNKNLNDDIVENRTKSIILIFKKASLMLSNRKEFNSSGGDILNHFETGYVEQEELYKLWVALLNSDNFEYIEKAYSMLLQHSRIDYLIKYENSIRTGIEKYRKMKCIQIQKIPCEDYDKKYIDHKSERLCVTCKKYYLENVKYEDIKNELPGDNLYMLLQLSDKEKSVMLGKNIPSHLKAKMGDKKEISKYIEGFKNSKNIHGMKKCAAVLGLIGTPECAKILIKGLNSPFHKKSINKKGAIKTYRSIRTSIIIALGRIHPEVEFLRKDISFIGRQGDKYYAEGKRIKEKTSQSQGEIIQSYLDKVISWAYKTYNVKPVDPAPEPILSIKKFVHF